VLASNVKRYDFVSEMAEDGGSAILYRIRLKKSTTADEFLDRFRAAAGSAIRKADFVD